jgi:short-subunit dehydrogenase
MSENILILGATSAIARACAEIFASEGATLILAGRDVPEIELIAADLRVRFGATVHIESFDATQYGDHAAFFQRCLDLTNGKLDGVVFVCGSLADKQAAAVDFTVARGLIESNYTSALSILTHAANYLEKQRAGWICAVSSVAGDRGRQSNYVYCSAKAGLSTYLQGLRNRLFPSGIAVIDVKPGFIDTAMTFGLPGVFLVASPEKAARDVRRAIRKRKNVIYTPWFWRWIMFIIKSIPEPIFKRMKL